MKRPTGAALTGAALAGGDTCHVTVQVRNSYGNDNGGRYLDTEATTSGGTPVAITVNP